MTRNQQLVVKQQADTVRQQLQKLMPQMKMALPRHLTPERLLRVTMTAVQATPKLLECDRKSFFGAIMTCAQLGLEPDGVMGQAYLVPFKGRVQFIAGYRGLLSLARNSGEISSIQAHEVCENDEFDYEYGLEEKLEHRPADGERGDITHFYAYAKFKDGGHVFEVMSRAQVDAVRDGSEGYKAFKAGNIKSTPWESHYIQMGRKTAIRRLANYLPMSVQRAVAIEDAVDRGQSASTDDFGDVVIEGEATVEDDTNGQTDDTTTKSKLDDLAGDEGGDEKDGEQTDKTASTSKDQGNGDGMDIPAHLKRHPLVDGDGQILGSYTAKQWWEAYENLVKGAKSKAVADGIKDANAQVASEIGGEGLA